MAPKILTIFGATGHQGGSIIDFVLNDPELSREYKIRAVTRDVNSEKARELKDKKKVEVVQADALDSASLETALVGTHTVFAMTMPSFGPDSVEVESASGRRIADAAVAVGAEYIIFSTLPSVSEISGGKYTGSFPFEAKARAERYIRTLPIRRAFFAPGGFMENYHASFSLAPRRGPDGTWVVSSHLSAGARQPLIYASGDSGKFIGAILAEPERYEGKTFCAATALYSLEQVAAAMSEATGETVVYRQIPEEEYREGIPAFAADLIVEGLNYAAEFGYFGPDSEGLVAWAAENARGRLTTLKEYLVAHPLELA